MQRTVFNEDHDAFRKTIRDFIAKEVAPVHHEWEGEGHPPRDFYNRLGELGVLGIQVPEEFGGGGETRFKFTAVVDEETAAAGVTFGSYSVHIEPDPAVPARVRDRRAEAALAPRIRLRRHHVRASR